MKAIATIPKYESFHTTQWGVIEGCLETDPAVAREGLTVLCHIYWRPVFAYICHRGYQRQDAEDLTQDFFIHLFRLSLIEKADQDKGRFRCFLIRSLTNFLNDETSRRRSIRRGGGAFFVSVDEFNSESPDLVQDYDPVHAYELKWAETIILHAIGEVQNAWARKEREETFLLLKRFLTGTEDQGQYRQVAGELDLTVSGVKSEVHRMRLKMREVIRQLVAMTVSSPEAVDMELRHLMKLLAAPGART